MSINILSRELDHKARTIEDADYDTQSVTPNTQLTEIIAGGEETVFEIAGVVWNPCYSYLNYDFTPAVAAVADNAQLLPMTTVPQLRTIRLETEDRVILCEINNAAQYLDMILPYETSYDEMMNNDIANLNSTTSRFKSLFSANSVATSNKYASTDILARNGFKDYNETRYNIQGGTNTANVPIMKYKIPLSIFKNTFLAVNQNFYFNGRKLRFVIVWESISNILTRITVADGVLADAVATSYKAVNLTLTVAVDKNISNINKIKAEIASSEGLNIIVPYVYNNLINITNANHTANVTYNSGQGLTLRKIYIAPYTAIKARFLHTVPADMVYYTTLNDNRIHNMDFRHAFAEDWVELRKRYFGCCIQSQEQFNDHYVWIQDFTNNYNKLEKQMIGNEDNLSDGQLLDKDLKFGYTVTGGPLSGSYYIYAVTQKVLQIKNEGIIFK